MAKNFSTDYDTYLWLLNMINNQQTFNGMQGSIEDMRFIKDNLWITQTAVIDRIINREGLWCIDLVFANVFEPLTLIIRNISSTSKKEKAMLYGSIFRRQAAKDQRGTLRIEIENYSIIEN